MDLPDDVLLDILARLPVSSVLALRRTCTRLCAATRLRALWTQLLRVHVLDPAMPCPGPGPLDRLPARDLEHLTRRALALRRVWTSPSPVPRRRLAFPTEPAARVVFLQFLPARNNRYLLSVSMSPRPRAYLLQCWDLAAHPRCIAELRHADGPYGGVVVNSDPTSTAVLAMQSAQTETFSIRFDADDPESAFETEATIDGIRELHLLSGSTLVTRRTDDGGALALWDLRDLRQECVQLINPSLVHPDDAVQAIHLAYDYALVVRVQSIEIYATTPCPSLLPLRTAPIAYPLAQFKLQWRTDAVVLAPCGHRTAPRPIHLLVRFGSIYPWPVNVLHHYVLPPNPAWRPSHGTSEYNLPYSPRPGIVHTICSPIRLFGQSAMALGPYGTAMWLDNHTDEWLGPGERGQRLASRVVTDMITPSAMATEITAPADATGATTVFGVRDDDDAWTRVAMDEEAGRIALGHTDGAITLLEY